ncbi:hypothetical protein JCM13304A_00240 [Desulfothermus okinawensis JCM 13304]
MKKIIIFALIGLIYSCSLGIAKVHRYTFNITIGKWSLLPDVQIKSLLINNQIPGPLIDVEEGDIVEVKVINKTPLPHTIHWHGLKDIMLNKIY